MIYRRAKEQPDGSLPQGDVVPWAKGVVFQCPCGLRTVYASFDSADHDGKDAHSVTYDDEGRATIHGSLGFRQRGNPGEEGYKPANWCHFLLEAGVATMVSDAQCPGATGD